MPKHAAPRRAVVAGLLGTILLAAAAGAAPIPPAEKLLPDDTLVVLTAPDFAKLRDLFRQAPMSQLWRDAAMKPFRDKLAAKGDEEVAKPLARELGVRFSDYADLPQGQLTLALTRNGWEGKADPAPAWLLLLDAKDKSGQLKTNLADLRKKWADAGRTLRTEKIRDVEFTLLALTGDDTPKTLKKLFSREEATTDAAEKKPGTKTELAVGQFESLLILGNSAKAVEKVVARLTGGAVPALGEVAAFEADRLAQFRDAPLYGWANAKVVMDVLAKPPSEKPGPGPRPDAPPSLDWKTVLAATGVSGLKSLAFSYRTTAEGALTQFTLGVPEAARVGLAKILAVEAKDAAPPAFVPAEAVKFQRMRMDGQKAWAALEKMAGDISPQWTSVLQMFLQTADKAGKEKDPGFDVRRDLIGNLGDDVLTWQKAPRGRKLDQLADAPSILLLGSPNAEKLALSLRNLFAAAGAEAGAPKEREFLGRKIYSATPPMFMPTDDPKGTPKVVHFTASAGYVAGSTDVALLEEWLRSGESPPKPLRDAAGLADAIQKAGGAGGGWLAYENEAEAMRALFEAFKNDPGARTNAWFGGPWSAPVNMATGGQSFQDWVDVSLLPPWDSVAKYFHFSVTSGAATPAGLSYRFFSPTPPGLKK